MNCTASAETKEEGPTISFAAGAMKRSAITVSLIHASTVLRKENTITLTPTVIATAAASAAIVMEFRRRARERFAAPSSASTAAFPRRCRTARRNLPAPALKCVVDHGTREENPARTKNAAAKPSQGGPVERARREKADAKKMETSPPHSHAADGRTDLSRIVPPCNARTGSICAAACAGSQAEAMTEAKPIVHAITKVHGSNATCFTFTRT